MAKAIRILVMKKVKTKSSAVRCINLQAIFRGANAMFSPIDYYLKGCHSNSGAVIFALTLAQVTVVFTEMFSELAIFPAEYSLVHAHCSKILAFALKSS